MELLEKKDIFLFKLLASKRECGKLSSFIRFLYWGGAKKPLKFSYVPPEGNLIGTMTLKENILLESFPNLLATSKESQFEHFMKKTGNIHLVRLFAKVKNIEEKASEVSAETRKIAALIKSLTQQSEYLLLENPEKHLSPLNLQLFIDALEYQTEKRDLITIVSSKEESIWLKSMTKIVTRGPKGEFLVAESINKKKKDDPKSEEKDTDQSSPMEQTKVA